MLLVERHLLYRLAILGLGSTLALTHVVIFASMVRLLPNVMSGRMPASLLWDVYAGLAPNVIYLTLPMTTALALVIGYNHFIASNNILVLYASGVSTWRVAVPGLAYAVVTAALGGAVAHGLAPGGAQRLEATKHYARQVAAHGTLPEGEFIDLVPGQATLHFKRWIERNYAADVFLSDRRNPDEERVISSKTANFTYDAAALNIVFHQGQMQTYDRERGKSGVVKFDAYSIELILPQAADWPRRVGTTPYERSLAELFDPPADIRADPRELRKAHAEGHKRLVTPFLSLFYGIVVLAVVLRWVAPDRRRTSKTAVLCAAIIAEHIAMLVLFDTGVRYSATLVPAVYALILAHIPLGVWLMAQLTVAPSARRPMRGLLQWS